MILTVLAKNDQIEKNWPILGPIWAQKKKTRTDLTKLDENWHQKGILTLKQLIFFKFCFYLICVCYDYFYELLNKKVILKILYTCHPLKPNIEIVL